VKWFELKSYLLHVQLMLELDLYCTVTSRNSYCVEVLRCGNLSRQASVADYFESGN